MFKVDAQTLDAYLAFDPARRPQLLAIDARVRAAAPELICYFHQGTPKGQPGMRFRMIGYGRMVTAQGLEWPALGLALQKSYISAYIFKPEWLAPWREGLGALRIGAGHFSFRQTGALGEDALAGLLRAAEQGWRAAMDVPR